MKIDSALVPVHVLRTVGKLMRDVHREMWPLIGLYEKLIKIGAKVVSHGAMSASRWPKSGCRGRRSLLFCRRSPDCVHHPRRHDRGQEQCDMQAVMEEVCPDTGKRNAFSG